MNEKGSKILPVYLGVPVNVAKISYEMETGFLLIS